MNNYRSRQMELAEDELESTRHNEGNQVQRRGRIQALISEETMQEHVMTEAEFEKTKAEINKMLAEAHKLGAEKTKLNAEARKMTREIFWYPVAIAIGMIGAVSTVTLLLARLLS